MTPTASDEDQRVTVKKVASGKIRHFGSMGILRGTGM